MLYEYCLNNFAFISAIKKNLDIVTVVADIVMSELFGEDNIQWTYNEDPTINYQLSATAI